MALDQRFSVAPMMDWTDRHCRVFHRLLTRRALLYTEMVTADAVIHGNPERFLAFDSSEHPVAFQLGGSDPAKLAAAARTVADAGYDLINLNVGCPSPRVQEGRFGACLMAEPALVADCLAAMREAVAVPVTVKCRIGIDDADPESMLSTFADTVVRAGVGTLVVHARKALLSGLSPKENREIPPLNYDRVYRLKREFPELSVIVNGGICSLDEAEAHLAYVDGVMLGRAAYRSPHILANVDRRLFGAAKTVSLEDAVRSFKDYVARGVERGVPLASMTRAMLGLFQGVPGARAWRTILTVDARRAGAGVEIIDRALAAVRTPARAAA